MFRYDPENDDKVRIKDVPEKDVLARISGNWKEKVSVSFAPDFKVSISSIPYMTAEADTPQNPVVLIDLGPLNLHPKVTPPLDVQLPNESLRFWNGVTEAITSRQFSRATTLKLEIEERQREKLKQRQDEGVEWTPRFFVGSVTPLGKPELTPDGEEALRRLERGEWVLEPNKMLGA